MDGAAVTRDAAAEATAAGAGLEQRLTEASALPKASLGPVLTALKQDIDAATMSYGLKVGGCAHACVSAAILSCCLVARAPLRERGASDQARKRLKSARACIA
jgi:hypothetical protein